MSVVDYILLAVVLALVILAILYMHRHKDICRGCQNCPYSGDCVKIAKKKKTRPPEK